MGYFPVAVKSAAKSMAEIYDFEGQPATVTRNMGGTWTVGTAATQSQGASSTLQGKAFLTESVTASANEEIAISLAIGGYTGNVLYPPYNSGGGSHWIGPGQELMFPLKQTLRASQVGVVASVTDAYKSGIASGSTFTYKGFVNVHGRYITDDMNWGADFIINVIGDSIAWGSGITTQNSDMWVFKVRDYYLSKGYNVRLRNWSVSGSTLTQHSNAFVAGIYSYREPGITLIPLGMNDSISGVATATSIAALNSMITYAGYYFPNHNLIVVPPSPALNATTEARNVTLRAAMLSYVAGLNNPKITCVNNMGNCLNVNTDLQADGVHPLVSGQLGIYNAVKAHVDIVANNAFTFTV